jgi:hypothetical protein
LGTAGDRAFLATSLEQLGSVQLALRDARTSWASFNEAVNIRRQLFAEVQSPHRSTDLRESLGLAILAGAVLELHEVAALREELEALPQNSASGEETSNDRMRVVIASATQVLGQEKPSIDAVGGALSDLRISFNTAQATCDPQLAAIGELMLGLLEIIHAQATNSLETTPSALGDALIARIAARLGSENDFVRTCASRLEAFLTATQA